MSVTIKIIGTAAGVATEFDGSYVQKYDPAFIELDGSYNGGILEVCHDPKDALQFDSAEAAMECWRRSFGLRPDGRENRPLTAFTVEISAVG